MYPLIKKSHLTQKSGPKIIFFYILILFIEFKTYYTKTMKNLADYMYISTDLQIKAIQRARHLNNYHSKEA